MLNSQQQAKRKSKRYKRSKEVTDYSFERLDASDIALNADTFNYSAMSITDTISNLPYAATITGPTFTILSSNLFPELDTTLHINNNHDSNININNNSQSIIYEEELYTLNLDMKITFPRKITILSTRFKVLHFLEFSYHPCVMILRSTQYYLCLRHPMSSYCVVWSDHN